VIIGEKEFLKRKKSTRRRVLFFFSEQKEVSARVAEEVPSAAAYFSAPGAMLCTPNVLPFSKRVTALHAAESGEGGTVYWLAGGKRPSAIRS
jgi:hypothetical protein